MIIFRNQEGITLIELVLVIFIITIILAISMPKSDFILNYREKKELINFKNDLVFSRNSAILDYTIYRVDIRPNKNYYIVYKFTNKWEKIKREDLKSGLRFRDNYLERIEVIFYPTGAPNQGRSIVFSNRKNQEIKVTISVATGKVTIYFDGDINYE